MTQMQRRSIRMHTAGLRERIEKGWTTQLQLELQQKFRDLTQCDGDEERERISARASELCDKGCYPEVVDQAYYSVGCCWWTDQPAELGSQAPTVSTPDGKGGFNIRTAREDEKEGHSLPCCPGCGALLMQGDLGRFIKSAQKNPDHYGGIDNFWRARGRVPCQKNWKDYAA